MTGHILVLGGVSEAVTLASTLAGLSGISVTYSLKGVTTNPNLPEDVTVHRGGYGGVDGLADYVARHGIRMIVDATHPFAVNISTNAAEAGKAAGIPVLRFTRPLWIKRDGETWMNTASLEEALQRASDGFEKPFLALGTKEAVEILKMTGCRPVVRSISMPADIPAHIIWLEARGPFNLEEEIALLRHHQCDCLVTRNSGGVSGSTKLDAARLLGIPVIMIDRPQSDAGAFTDLDEIVTRISDQMR